MTARELLDAYAPVREAVAWTEFFVCTPPVDGENRSGWDLMMASVPPMSPAEAVAFLRVALDETIREEAPNPKFVLARSQMDRPEFLTYVAGKMGCM